MILLAASNQDIAGTNIAKQLIKQNLFNKTNRTHQDHPIYEANISNRKITLITTNEEAFNTQNLPNNFPNPELIIFLSRHSSQSGTPTLSVHTPGNFASAELGGLPKNLSISPANAMHDTLKALKRVQQEKNLNYQVSYECTHHGPSLNVPTMFAELGSSPTQWNDETAAATVAQATIEAIANFGKTHHSAAIGIGGTHYNQKFTNMALQGEAIFGHMIPKYALPFVDREILQQCREKTLEQVESAILDWKGIRSENKPTLLKTLHDIGLPIIKV